MITIILKGDDLDRFKNFDIKVSIVKEYYCEDCATEFDNNEIIHLRNKLLMQVDLTIKAIIIENSIKSVGYDCLNSQYLPKIDLKYVANLHDGHNELKSEITNLFYVKDIMDNRIPEKFIIPRGGDTHTELINWIISEIPSAFASIVIAFLLSTGKKGLNKIKEIKFSIEIQKRIKKKILGLSDFTDWKDITFDELEKYFFVPKKYNGDIDELIEDIVNEKSTELSKKLYENYEEKSNRWHAIFWPKGK